MKTCLSSEIVSVSIATAPHSSYTLFNKLINVIIPTLQWHFESREFSWEFSLKEQTPRCHSRPDMTCYKHNSPLFKLSKLSGERDDVFSAYHITRNPAK